jgi:hypothetical protein
MQHARCEVCGRVIARERDGLRMHRTKERPLNPPKGWTAAPWCNGPEVQLRLPGFAP